MINYNDDENDYETESLRNGVLFVLAWVACLRGWRAYVGSVGGVLAWVMRVVYVYVFTCALIRFGVISQIKN